MSQITEKSLGQVLYEADTAISTMPGGGWHTMDRRRQAGYERMAQALAAVVLEQVAERVLDLTSEEGESRTPFLRRLAQAIRSMKP